VDVDADALEQILRVTKGYAYFLQQWGSHAWRAADRSPITKADVDTASLTAIAALDESPLRSTRAKGKEVPSSNGGTLSRTPPVGRYRGLLQGGCLVACSDPQFADRQRNGVESESR
jgi:hypothetical protein